MNEKICPKCGTKQDKSFKFCKNCGELLPEEPEQVTEIENSDVSNQSDEMKICPECGTKQDKSFKFCRNYGTLLPEKKYEYETEQESSSKNNESTSKNENILKCSNCGCELNSEKYCPDCGKATGIKICPNCQKITLNKNFCSSCGYNFKHTDNTGSKINKKTGHKSPLFALVLSGILPGVGQIYNNQNNKGTILIIAYMISAFLCFILIGVPLIIAIWIYGMYDAFKTAIAINNGETVQDRLF